MENVSSFYVVNAYILELIIKLKPTKSTTTNVRQLSTSSSIRQPATPTEQDNRGPIQPRKRQGSEPQRFPLPPTHSYTAGPTSTAPVSMATISIHCKRICCKEMEGDEEEHSSKTGPTMMDQNSQDL